MTRHFKQLICHLLIGVFLFAQMAVVSYACPQSSPVGLNQVSVSIMSSDDNPSMDIPACCDGMERPDMANPNLCTEHAHFGQLNDQTQIPTLPAILLTSLYVVSTASELNFRFPPAALANFLAESFPPHAILHCCFRI
ncbi:MAG TPA: hypothetical protein PKZ67_10810 [Accumulibacter sp.]|uniref:hypothetical protein n=1 Tax=Zoogloea sp. TaxID=49181 RepID=UPI002C7786ED|nr:hypothetical protein [Pseudomonadota bacterium]HNF92681.1 hypothetical protein [Accumulibacter sp.]